MKFEEVYPDYKQGRTIKYGSHTFKKGEHSVIQTDWLDSEDWSVCSTMDEWTEVLCHVPCVDFRHDDAWDMLDLNIIDIMEDWDIDTESSKEHELKEITWHIPRKTQIHFVSNFHLFAGDSLTLNEDGVMTLFTVPHLKHSGHVNGIELIYLTGEYEW